MDGCLHGFHYKSPLIRQQVIHHGGSGSTLQIHPFFALLHLCTPTLVAQVFMDQILKLHGIPTSIVYENDPTFTRNFLQNLFKPLVMHSK